MDARYKLRVIFNDGKKVKLAMASEQEDDVSGTLELVARNSADFKGLGRGDCVYIDLSDAESEPDPDETEDDDGEDDEE